ncbi:MAG: hypothetical protein RIB45_17730 [Marivibrio sp.]|uniref:hypothetical protein n=1 Tax=Marivibrio sp. TaxID=2039719 RepID=UPI0032EE4F28
MAELSNKIRTLHAAGVDPVEICCRLLVSWQTVEAAVKPAAPPETPIWVGIDMGRRAETGAPTTAVADGTPEHGEQLTVPRFLKRRIETGPPTVTAAEIRRRQEREKVDAWLAEKEPTRRVNFGEDEPAVLYLRRCGFTVYGAPQALKKRGRWMVNGAAHTSKALWERAANEAKRRGEPAPRRAQRDSAK